MNMKSDTLNPSSLVLGGPSLESYHLLWFIRRCVCLFDVLSWEVLHLLEQKMLWKQAVDLQDSHTSRSRGQFFPKRCFDMLCHVHIKITCQTIFLFTFGIYSDIIWSCTFLSITYSLKMWLERRKSCHGDAVVKSHITKIYFFSVDPFAKYN